MTIQEDLLVIETSPDTITKRVQTTRDGYCDAADP